VPDSIRSTPPSVLNGLPGGTDKRLAERVILEILKQVHDQKGKLRGLDRESLTAIFWSAHLYYAKRNPGYLTNWPLLRSRWGVEIKDASALLAELVEEGLLQVEQVERGPFPVAVYCPTGKEDGAELPGAAVQAIRQAWDEASALLPFRCGWPPLYSRTWRHTPEGEEMDVYLDLIPEELYEEQRRELEGLRAALSEPRS
jgi:hypothetical protein